MWLLACLIATVSLQILKFVNLSAWLATNLSEFMPFISVCQARSVTLLSAFMGFCCLSLWRSVCLSKYHSECRSLRPRRWLACISVSVYLLSFVYLSVCQTLCLCNWLSVCLPVCLSVFRKSVLLSHCSSNICLTRPTVQLSVELLSVCLSLHRFVQSFVCLSVSLSV